LFIQQERPEGRTGESAPDRWPAIECDRPSFQWTDPSVCDFLRGAAKDAGEYSRDSREPRERPAALSGPSLLKRGKGRKFRVGFALIPVSDRCNVIGQRLVSTIRPPTKRLDGHAQVVLEINRTRDVPAIQAPLRRAVFRNALERTTLIGG